MADLPPLSEEEIENWTDPRSFQRGESYYEDGAIRNPRVQGNRLLAECRGSSASAYRVEVTLDEKSIESGYCSCPVGGGCKHCVALLLTWLYEPESFTTQEVVQKSLEERSREELVALIEQMVARYPDLETLLAMPIPGVSPAESPLDPALIRRQVIDAILSMGYDDWDRGYGSPSASQLYTVLGQGTDYQNAQAWANATVVFRTLADEVMDSYEEMYDEEGEVAGVVDSCAEGLGVCLEAITDPEMRGQIVQTLYNIYRWDLDLGGIGGGDQASVVLTEQTDSAEKAEVAGWVRSLLATQQRRSDSSWATQKLGGFLLELESETLSDEDYLRLCRETGRNEDLIRRLLVLGRSEDAAAETRQAATHQTVSLSQIIYAAGHTSLAEQILQERVGQDNDRNILSKLIEWVLARNAPSEALALALRLFGQSKNISVYQQVQEIAGLVGRWPQVQAELLGGLEKESNFPLLTQIYVEEQRVDDALAALKRIGESQRRPLYYHPTELNLSVARLAAKNRPQAAIEIYTNEAQHSIAGRSRDNYKIAATHLRRVKTIYEQMGESALWKSLIAQIRQEYKRLPALQDELNKAGL